MASVPYVIEQTHRGERVYDIYSRLLKDRIILLGTEIFVTTCMISIVGRDAFDRRSVVTIAKSLAIGNPADGV